MPATFRFADSSWLPVHSVPGCCEECSVKSAPFSGKVQEGAPLFSAKPGSQDGLPASTDRGDSESSISSSSATTVVSQGTSASSSTTSLKRGKDPGPSESGDAVSAPYAAAEKRQVFKSTVYADVPPADEIVSVFASAMTLEQKSEGGRRGEEGAHGHSHDLDPAGKEEKEETGNPPIQAGNPPTHSSPAPSESQAGPNDAAPVACNEGATGNPAGAHPAADDDDGGAVGGAWGGKESSQTVEQLLMMEGVSQMYAVQPLPFCPHLVEVKPLPSTPLDVKEPCGTCGDQSENWVCLTCYKVECSRFVNEHMLYHKLETDHNMCLSFSDLSVWCYACDHYIDNQVLQPMKSAAHYSKFGQRLPGSDP